MSAPDLKHELDDALSALVRYLEQHGAGAIDLVRAREARARLKSATITEPGQADLNNPLVRESLESFLDDARQHAPRRLADEAQRLLRILKPEPDPREWRVAVNGPDGRTSYAVFKRFDMGGWQPTHFASSATPPPPPDPCVVECGSIQSRRNGAHLRIDDRVTATSGEINLNRTEAAALIPALQAFVREGGE